VGDSSGKASHLRKRRLHEGNQSELGQLVLHTITFTAYLLRQ
jgi:hypothetical protein